MNWALWAKPVILALSRLKQEEQGFYVSPWSIVRPCLSEGKAYFICVCACLCSCIQKPENSLCCPSLEFLSTLFFETGSLTDLELTMEDSLADQGSLGIFPSPPPQRCDYKCALPSLAFSHELWESNLGPHSCKAGIFPMQEKFTL